MTVAEDILDGTACDICGMYFIDPKNPQTLYTHGHPATCWECEVIGLDRIKNALSKSAERFPTITKTHNEAKP